MPKVSSADPMSIMKQWFKWDYPHLWPVWGTITFINYLLAFCKAGIWGCRQTISGAGQNNLRTELMWCVLGRQGVPMEKSLTKNVSIVSSHVVNTHCGVLFWMYCHKQPGCNCNSHYRHRKFIYTANVIQEGNSKCVKNIKKYRTSTRVRQYKCIMNKDTAKMQGRISLNQFYWIQCSSVIKTYETELIKCFVKYNHHILIKQDV